jgi:hypothetical protein
MGRRVVVPKVVLIMVAALVGCAVGVAAAAAEPLAFEGLGLGDFTGAESVAAALRSLDADAAQTKARALRVAVQGPGGRDQQSAPLAAEVRSRLEGVDVAAGMLADPDVVWEGPTRWTGRIGVSSNRPTGRESLELRTVLGRNGEAGLLGLELGPRLERRFEDGMTIFLDGKAEAQAMRSAETGWWTLPTPGGAGGAVGVAARTGLTW